MIKLLIRLFIKNSEDIQNSSVRRSYGILCSIVGILLNVLLFAGKYFIGITSRSIAITADAFNNLSDAGSSIITLIGFKFSGTKADSAHPFGHGRFEYVCGFAVSVIIMIMGVELVRSSIDKILHPVSVNSGAVTIVILLISVCIKLYMCFYNRRMAAKVNSVSMKATATDSLTDAIATSVVLISILLSKITDFNIDGWCGILVGFFILYAGYSTAKETLSPLLGKAPDPKLVKEIEEIVLSHDEVIGIHDLIVHDYGPGRLIISLHGEVPGDGDIYELHDAIDCIEKELNKKLGCESCLHMDPLALNDHEATEMHAILSEEIKTIDERITIHDFRIVRGSTHRNLIFDAMLPYDLALSDDEARARIDTLVKFLWENCFTVITIDKSYI